VHKQFRRFDIAVGVVFAVLVIIGLVTVNSGSKSAANSSPTARATAADGSASAPAAVRSGTPTPPTASSLSQPPPKLPRPPSWPAAAPVRDRATPVHAAPAQAASVTRPAPPPPTQPAPQPSPPPPTKAAPAAPTGCTPKTNAGNCYEPGEFCRASDHGVTGVAGDGKAIKCEDNDGWRWEPV
jgi:hypothetical protein